MVTIVYVNEYQPSSATLSLVQDPIYRQSNDLENIKIGAPVAVSQIPLWPVIPVALTTLLLIYSFKNGRKRK